MNELYHTISDSATKKRHRIFCDVSFFQLFDEMYQIAETFVFCVLLFVEDHFVFFEKVSSVGVDGLAGDLASGQFIELALDFLLHLFGEVGVGRDENSARHHVVLRLGEHVAAQKPLLDYFPQELREEALLMLPQGVDPASLVAYDIIAMMDEEYKDTYGDVNVEMFFGTAYRPDKAMVVLAGFPVEGATEAPWMDWYVLRAEALQDADGVEIGLKQLFLPWMEEKPLMLVVISEMLDAQE